ncbi:cytochrome P450 4V2-like [Actinia tenebrosa]|uniref:Cytochrome P450 4V2-like n=1 Tax=Actinia tenebrosa TaxID=6105 RepID=A0A6P8I1N5_ACTTE|nr:cytochrome P450 4V2-like [Actinia tenebrosa]XP_031558795.1 cytochrome P450 4V2-like [Actinia tenebrosa]
METSRSEFWPLILALSVGVPLVFAVWGLMAWKRAKNAMKVLETLPGPKKSFFFGNAMQFKRDGSDFNDQLLQWSKEYQENGYFCLWFGPFHTMIFTFRPDFAELLLSSSRNITKSFLYTFVHPWLGTGLLTSTGEKWKRRRRQITPTFHFKILNVFIQVFEEQSKILVSVLKDECEKGKLDIFPKITRCALDIICESSMGKSVNAQIEGNSPYVNAVLRMSEVLLQRAKSPWLWPDFVFHLSSSGRIHKHCLNMLHGFTNKVIDERLLERKSSAGQEEREVDEFTGKRKKRPLAFLDLLLDAFDDGQIDREGIREEVDTFMFEGHDTTAAAMTWVILLLGQHPDVQNKAQQEVDEFFESRPEQLTVDSMKDLKYLECVIKESLRLYPSVPFFGRKITDDFVIDGVAIPKGETVVVAPMALHHNPNVWPDPERFDPDRFLPENSEGRHPYAYVPFSAGPRNCIGQRFALLEEKVVLANILRHFNVKSEQSRDQIRVCAELITRPQDGIFVTLTPRDNV